jgi:hypothetical protein
LGLDIDTLELLRSTTATPSMRERSPIIKRGLEIKVVEEVSIQNKIPRRIVMQRNN